ncbi:MAG TPA: carboxypeptidase-like regulatory domain-containing protein [Rhodothermales bacterium]|nr:carboxypeptidase-like regulatory domain-containing protein [Rhodothermales bacterium]
MRRALRGAALPLLAALVMLAASGCDSGPIEGDPDPGPVTDARGSVRGSVTDNNGAAVPNVEVVLTGNGFGLPTLTTNSGADGAYTFADVPIGAYTLKVTPPPWVVRSILRTSAPVVTSSTKTDASPWFIT